MSGKEPLKTVCFLISVGLLHAELTENLPSAFFYAIILAQFYAFAYFLVISDTSVC